MRARSSACRSRRSASTGRRRRARCSRDGHGVPVFSGVDAALAQADTQLRLFGKPRVEGQRRVAVTLARGEDIDQARERARKAASELHIELR